VNIFIIIYEYVSEFALTFPFINCGLAFLGQTSGVRSTTSTSHKYV
jgi:hypothetical protein